MNVVARSSSIMSLGSAAVGASARPSLNAEDREINERFVLLLVSGDRPISGPISITELFASVAIVILFETQSLLLS
jgi:hypothetical protein